MNVQTDCHSHPSVILGSGLRIVNFSSPHPFTFDTGEILEACPPEMSRELSLQQEEEIAWDHPDGTKDIRMSFKMSEGVKKALEALVPFCESDEDSRRRSLQRGMRTIVLVPFPVLEACKSEHEEVFDQYENDVGDYSLAPLRTYLDLLEKILTCIRVVRMADRVTKRTSSTVFCI